MPAKPRRFALFFRMDILAPEAQPTPDQMAVYMERWGEWIAWIRSHDRLEDGNHFLSKGAVLRGDGAEVDSPYVAGNESIAGYILVRAKNLQDALKIARKCPILEGDGTSVEVREVAGPQEG